MEKKWYTETLGPIDGYTFTDVTVEPWSDDEEGYRITFTTHDGEFSVNRDECVYMHFWGTPSCYSVTVWHEDGDLLGYASEDGEYIYTDSFSGEEWNANLLTEICALIERA